jgi:LPS-assembly protein
MSFRLPIYDKWYAVGRWQYSLLYHQTQDGLFGVEKENCCWRLRIVGRHYINNINSNASVIANANLAPTGTAQNGLFFEIDLKGLTNFATADVDNFFAQTIYGYRASKNDW